MTDDERNKAIQTLADLGHAIQTGVAMEQSRGSNDGSPKQLRTGLNIALVEIGAIGRLLVAKNICTEEEYFTTMIAAYKDEVARYEQRLSQQLGGAKITLG